METGEKRQRMMFLLVGTLALICLSCVHTDESIIGLSQNEIIATYGIPDDSSTISLSSKTPLYEYQNGLLRWYEESGKKDTIQVMEMSWNGPIWTVIVWLNNKNGEWKTIDQLQYTKGVQF